MSQRGGFGQESFQRLVQEEIRSAKEHIDSFPTKSRVEENMERELVRMRENTLAREQERLRRLSDDMRQEERRLEEQRRRDEEERRREREEREWRLEQERRREESRIEEDRKRNEERREREERDRKLEDERRQEERKNEEERREAEKKRQDREGRRREADEEEEDVVRWALRENALAREIEKERAWEIAKWKEVQAALAMAGTVRHERGAGEGLRSPRRREARRAAHFSPAASHARSPHRHSPSIRSRHTAQEVHLKGELSPGAMSTPALSLSRRASISPASARQRDVSPRSARDNLQQRNIMSPRKDTQGSPHTALENGGHMRMGGELLFNDYFDKASTVRRSPAHEGAGAGVGDRAGLGQTRGVQNAEADAGPAGAAGAIWRAFQNLPNGLTGWFVHMDTDADG